MESTENELSTTNTNDGNNVSAPQSNEDTAYQRNTGTIASEAKLGIKPNTLTSYTTPGHIEVNDDETIYSLLTGRVSRTGNDTIIAARKIGPGKWEDISTGEFHRLVISAAKGFISLGVNKGDTVTIFSSTRYEWGVLDFALAAIGAVNVPIYDTDSSAQAQVILNDSAVIMAIADNRERFDRINSVKANCPQLNTVLMLDANALGALEGLGVTVSDNQLQERIDDVKADDLATIVYTSGSTGSPKGVELSHRNFLSIVRAGYDCLSEVLFDDNPRLLLFLPLAHCFARYIQYCSIGSDDGVIGYLPDSKSLLPDLRSFKPTYLLGVPRVYEKVYNAASRKAGVGLKGKLFAKAAQAARIWSRTLEAGLQPSAKQVAEHIAFETPVYRAVRGALGPNIRYVACGGAPLDENLAHFFEGIGLHMIQGYGLTETAAPFTVNRVSSNKIGTVGQPAPGNSARVSDDGEIELKGPNVFVGYHNLPEQTAAVMTEDGWLKSGDLGSIDSEGRLIITGRKKDIIITSGGKNVSPIPLEQQISQCSIVEHAVVVGDGRPFIGAVVTLDSEGLEQWLPTQHQPKDLPLAEAAKLPEVQDFIQQYVDYANVEVSRAESVRKFVILPEQFSQDNGCLTASLKVVRPKVLHIFADIINRDLYGSKA